MPDRARIATARCNAQLTALWLSTCVDGDIPSKVTAFFNDDLPHLFATLNNAGTDDHDDSHLTPQDQIVEAPRTPGRLAELVDLARLADAAVDAPDPALWQLRERDLDRVWRRYCPHRIRLIAEAAVRELAYLGWCRPRAERRPTPPSDAAWLDEPLHPDFWGPEP